MAITLTLDIKHVASLLRDGNHGGGLPEVTIRCSCVGDWQRILLDAHAGLARQLSYYMQEGNEENVKAKLKEIELICVTWRNHGQFE